MQDFYMKKISIIVPVYRAELYIQDCLISIVSQSYRGPIELIIVDDGSDDTSLSCIKRFLDNYRPWPPNVSASIFAHENNRGQSAARNTGINAATGDYILFVDADDLLYPNCIQLLVEMSDRTNADLILGENVLVNGQEERYVANRVIENYLDGNSLIRASYLRGEWYNVPWNKLISRALIVEEMLYFKEGFFCEDELWGFMLATKAKSLAIVRKPTYRYIQHNDSITQSKSLLQRNQELFRLLPAFKDFIVQTNIQNDLNVSKYYLLRLSSIAFVLNRNHAITYDIFTVIQQLNYVNVYLLRNKELLTRKEYLAYTCFEERSGYLGWLWFKLIGYYFDKKQSSC